MPGVRRAHRWRPRWVHGRHDDVVSVQQALALKQHIAQARLILYDFGHSDGPPDWAVYWRDIFGFLEAAGIVER